MNLEKKNWVHQGLHRFIGIKKSIRYLILATLFLSMLAFMSVENKATENKNLESHISMINGMKAFTLELAEAMPADKYTFRPHDSVRSFGEQLAHISLSTTFLLDIFIKGKEWPTDPAVFANIGKMEQELGVSKEACIKSLTETFDNLEATYNSMDAETLKETFVVPFDPQQPTFTKAKGFQFINEHLAHHRGQALVSLRMQGIKSPPYRLY